MPKPSTLKPRPTYKHPMPKPLNLKPSTFNTQPCTLQPGPTCKRPVPERPMLLLLLLLLGNPTKSCVPCIGVAEPSSSSNGLIRAAACVSRSLLLTIRSLLVGHL